jgi:hypothetical protein
MIPVAVAATVLGAPPASAPALGPVEPALVIGDEPQNIFRLHEVRASRPQIAANPARAENLVVWARGRYRGPNDVVAQRLRSRGERIGDNFTVGGRWVHGVDLASSPSTGGYLVAWIELSGVYGQRLGGAGEPIGPRLTLSSSKLPYDDLTVVMAHDPARGRHLVIWNGADGLRGRFVTEGGEATDGELVVSDSKSVPNGLGYDPGSRRFAVGWGNLVQFLDEDARPLGQAAEPAGPEFWRPGVARGAKGYLVTEGDGRGRLVDPEGIQPSESSFLDRGCRGFGAQSAAWDEHAGEFVITWLGFGEYPAMDFSNHQVLTARISDGVAEDPEEIDCRAVYAPHFQRLQFRRASGGLRAFIEIATDAGVTTVELRLRRKQAGRRIDGVCRRVTRRNRRSGPFCVHLGRAHKLVERAFDGVPLDRFGKLPPGAYRASVVAIGVRNARSETRTIDFSLP